MSSRLNTHQAERLAKVYDTEVTPLWTRRFGKMLLSHVTLPERAQVLDVGCATGYATLEILKRLDTQGRIIALDSSMPLLNQARARAGMVAGKRVFFRSERALPKLNFADEVYDLAISNASIHEYEDLEALVGELARVVRVDGQVLVSLPLAGTFQEFNDIFREVLVKLDRQDAIERLETYLTRYPPLDRVQMFFESVGLDDVVGEWERFTLLFASAREFFFAPLIEYGPLIDWKSIAGKGAQMQETFLQVKQAIDTYYGDRPFAVTVVAGCVRGRKSGGSSPYPLIPTSDTEVDAETAEVERLSLSELEALEQAEAASRPEAKEESPEESREKSEHKEGEDDRKKE